MQVDAAGEQDHHEQDADHLAILFVEDVADGFDVFPGHGRFEPRRHRHDQESEPADPHDGREQVQPVIDNGNDFIEIGQRGQEGIHQNLNTGFSLPKRFWRSSSINSTVIRGMLCSRACRSVPFFTMARRK